MAGYPSHYLLTWGGSIVNGSAPIEEWSNTLRGKFINNDGTGAGSTANITRDEGELTKWLTDTAAPRLVEFITSNDAHISGAARLEWVKVNRIDAAGHYAESFTAGVYGLSAQGSGGPLKFPLQVSLAVTLETAVKRGNANRGRIFLPTPSTALASSGVIAGADVQNVIDAVGTLLEGLSDFSVVEQVKFVPSVVSKGGKKDPTGAMNTITHVSVDNRLDIQRSRANQQATSRTVGEDLDFGSIV